jgi:hypothetical protein
VDKRALRGTIWNIAEACLAEACLTQTAESLHEARAANATEISHGVALVRKSHACDKPADLLETIAKIQGHSEEHLGSVILNFGNKVASNLCICHPLIPFASRLLAPTAFYNSFEQIHKIARILLTPVIYAEDPHVIGIASINPVASAILTEEIRSIVFKRLNIRPFVTVACLDYESWTLLTRKHFELSF